MTVVWLAALSPQGTDTRERTYTDNLSGHGVRVVSTRLWHPGQQAQVTPVNEDSPVRGQVVYCQKLDDSRFCVGLNFPQKIPWLVQQRFDGIE